MKNVTIALDDETYRKARIRAAELGTSLSALVKSHLIGLAESAAPAAAKELREMPQAFKAFESAPDGPPWLVNGEWVYTLDGKPRQPGALRRPGKIVDLPDTPDWLIEAMEEWSQDRSDPLA